MPPFRVPPPFMPAHCTHAHTPSRAAAAAEGETAGPRRRLGPWLLFAGPAACRTRSHGPRVRLLSAAWRQGGAGREGTRFSGERVLGPAARGPVTVPARFTGQLPPARGVVLIGASLSPLIVTPPWGDQGHGRMHIPSPHLKDVLVWSGLPLGHLPGRGPHSPPTRLSARTAPRFRCPRPLRWARGFGTIYRKGHEQQETPDL